MKKIIVVLCMLVFMLMVTGCGKKDETPDEDIDAVDLGDVVVDSDKDTTTISVTDGQETVVTNEEWVSVPLPDGYPEDILPIYKDAHIPAVNTNVDGSVSIVLFTKDPIDQVITFYDDHLVDAQVFAKQKDADYYTNMGELAGSAYTVIINTSDEEGYATTVILTVIPDQSFDMPDMSDE